MADKNTQIFKNVCRNVNMWSLTAKFQHWTCTTLLGGSHHDCIHFISEDSLREVRSLFSGQDLMLYASLRKFFRARQGGNN